MALAVITVCLGVMLAFVADKVSDLEERISKLELKLSGKP